MLYNWFSNLYIKVTYKYAKYLLAAVRSAFTNVYAKRVLLAYSPLLFYEYKLKAHV